MGSSLTFLSSHLLPLNLRTQEKKTYDIMRLSLIAAALASAIALCEGSTKMVIG